MMSVKSSNVGSVGYDPLKKVMEVEFKGGSLYRYANVPHSLFKGFISTESPGKFFHQNVKGLGGVKVIKEEGE